MTMKNWKNAVVLAALACLALALSGCGSSSGGSSAESASQAPSTGAAAQSRDSYEGADVMLAGYGSFGELGGATMQLPPDWQRRFDSSDDKHALQKTEYSAPGDTVRLYIGYYDETYEQDAQKHVDWYEEHRHEYGPAKSEDAEVGGHPAKRVTVERFATIYCVQLTVPILILSWRLYLSRIQKL